MCEPQAERRIASETEVQVVGEMEVGMECALEETPNPRIIIDEPQNPN